jgi:transcriptional regulator with XRE-family HTH domain
MRENSSLLPYRALGKKLKTFRVQAKETLADTSGAVEVDVKQMAAYELGQARPAEDILLLLISHFGAHADEAVHLWELAGYNLPGKPTLNIAAVDVQQTDPLILYTDVVDVAVNNHGVVMKFMQTTNQSSPPKIVAKVGMSREHAKSIVKILQITLERTDKQLPGVPKRIITPDVRSPEE